MLPVLAMLSAVAPLATDLYLPAFPELAQVFAADATRVQFTLTAFLLGLALGQLFIGPMSDQWGRRRPLLIGTGICFLASLVCVVAPSLEVLTAARFVQGASGAAGVVLARAIVADTTQGGGAAKMLGIMMMIGGVAPITAPVIGSFLQAWGGWQWVFGVLAGLVGGMFAGAWWRIPETLPPQARHAGGVHSLLHSAAQVLSHGRFVAYMLTSVSAFAALFAYISASPFVMQNVLGLSAHGYGVAFGMNALGLVASGAVAVRLAGRVPLRRMVAMGLAVLLCATAAQVANVWWWGTPAVTLLLLWLSLASLGWVFGNTTALALTLVPQWRGTASAFMGALQFGFGAAVSPLVGLAGTHSAVPMAVVMLLAAMVSNMAFWGWTRDHSPGQ